MIVYRLEIADTKYPHNGIICGISDCLGVESVCLSYGNASDPKKQELIDMAHWSIDQLGDPDSPSYIAVPYKWSTDDRYFCFFTPEGIKRCMDNIMDLIHVCIETGHPVMLWCADTRLFDEIDVVYTDKDQVVILVDNDNEWNSRIKSLFKFRSEKSAKVALKLIQGEY